MRMIMMMTMRRRRYTDDEWKDDDAYVLFHRLNVQHNIMRRVNTDLDVIHLQQAKHVVGLYKTISSIRRKSNDLSRWRIELWDQKIVLDLPLLISIQVGHSSLRRSWNAVLIADLIFKLSIVTPHTYSSQDMSEDPMAY